MADTNTIESELHKKAFKSLTKTYLRLGRAHPNEFLAGYDKHMIAMHKLHAKLTTPVSEVEYEEQEQEQAQEQQGEDVEIEEVEEDDDGNKSEDGGAVFDSESEEEQVVQPARILKTVKRDQGSGKFWSEGRIRAFEELMKARFGQEPQSQAPRQLDIN